MLESILTQTQTSVSIGSCLICIFVAFILGIIIATTHKLTSKTTPNFLLTLTILPVLVQVVIFMINGNLGTAFAVAGAFSLVRFRSMAIGLALGMGYVAYSVLVTIIVALLVIVITKISLRVEDLSERKLKIIIPEDLDYEEVFNDIFEKYTSKYEIRKVKTTNMGSMYELTYIVNMKKDAKDKAFMDEIRCRNGNMLVMLERQELSEVEL